MLKHPTGSEIERGGRWILEVRFLCKPRYLQCFLTDDSFAEDPRFISHQHFVLPKTKQFCETSSMFELDNVKNEAILRAFLIFRSWQHQKRKNSARLPSKMESWVQSCGLVPMRFCNFSSPPVQSTAPATKKWCQVIQSAAPVTQNHRSKPEDLRLQNVTLLRKSAPGPPNSSDEESLVLCLPRKMHLFPTPAIVFGNATKPPGQGQDGADMPSGLLLRSQRSLPRAALADVKWKLCCSGRTNPPPQLWGPIESADWALARSTAAWAVRRKSGGLSRSVSQPLWKTWLTNLTPRRGLVKGAWTRVLLCCKDMFFTLVHASVCVGVWQWVWV